MPGKLWENTRDWHHKCEGHPVGAAMASGNPPKEWYAAWLSTLLGIHYKIDPYMPQCAVRANRLAQDINDLGVNPIIPIVVTDFMVSDISDDVAMGYAYVLTGAHLMGGEIMRRRLQGYPTNHLLWDDRKETLEYLQTLRDQEAYTQGALDCFQLLYNSMEAILGSNTYK